MAFEASTDHEQEDCILNNRKAELIFMKSLYCHNKVKVIPMDATLFYYLVHDVQINLQKKENRAIIYL